MEALKFLKMKKSCFAPNMFHNNKEAISFCKKLYKFGCTKIDIDFDESLLEDDELEELFADSMAVTLPKTMPKRLDVVSYLLDQRPDEISADAVSCRPINWRKDKAVFFWWD